MNCPRCGESDCFVKNTRILPTGKRKRRYGCQVCEYRWTVYEKIEGAEVKVPIKRAGPPPRRMFTDKQAATIMLSTESRAALANFYGVSRQAIDSVKTGKTYTHVYNKLKATGETVARVSTAMCVECVHWWGERGCTFGFPDAGDDFAMDCFVFERR